MKIQGENSFTFLKPRESTDPIAQRLEPEIPTNQRAKTTVTITDFVRRVVEQWKTKHIIFILFGEARFQSSCVIGRIHVDRIQIEEDQWTMFFDRRRRLPTGRRTYR